MSSTNAIPPDQRATTIAAPVDPWIGRKLKKYAILAQLGKGGMGVVYLASDTALQRVVAVKMLSRDNMDSLSVKRFMREAQSAAKLQHANVASIYDIDEDQGAPFLVMEFVSGPTAQQMLDRQGPLPWRVATQIAADVARGLAAAHAARLVHRDIKPANILIAKTGDVKLGDFGLAKAITDKQTVLTLGNQIIGTPTYMSPEQAQSGTVDERSDVYSLGATYYALLTGQPPFPGKDIIGTVYAHVSQPPPDPRARVPDVPEVCCAIVRRALAKRRADRYADARAMQADLDAILGPTREPLDMLAASYSVPTVSDATAVETSITVPNTRPSLPAWLVPLAVAGSVAVFGIVIIGVLAWWRPWHPVQPIVQPKPIVRAEDSVPELAVQLKQRNPGFDGRFKADVHEGRIRNVTANVDRLVILDPLTQLRELESLDLSGTSERSSVLSDVSFISQLPKLKRVRFHSFPLKDLTPFKGLSGVEQIDIGGTKVNDLTPLSHLPLVSLRVGGTAVTDLNGLGTTPLEKLYVGYSYRLTSLKGLPVQTIRWLGFESTEVTNLDQLKQAKQLEYLNFRQAKLTRDQRPAKGQPAQRSLSPRDFETLLMLPNLKTVVGEFTPAEKNRLETQRPGLRALTATPDESF